jgi:glycosyltransferase involved in cell wall biosynthesis
MRISILWSSLASYSVAFFRELAVSEKCSVQLCYQESQPEAPYSPFDLSFCEESAQDSVALWRTLEQRVRDFAPDCILINGWAYRHFMSIARRMRRSGVHVVAVMDNQWRGTFKQYLGILSAPWILKTAIDTFLAAGERQAQFARKLGYDQILHGCYAAEVERFATSVSLSLRPRAFVFAGRLVPVKNLAGLLDAYRLYRDCTSEPWRLIVAGAGPQGYLLEGVPGVEALGFVEPSGLPEVMRNARCLVLPSIFEPWGVAIHEAAAAGLPVIASFRCGAVTAFVRDGVNGFLVEPTPKSIAAAMLRMAQSSDESACAMSEASVALARLWDPSKLAKYVVTMISERLNTGQQAKQKHTTRPWPPSSAKRRAHTACNSKPGRPRRWTAQGCNGNLP